MKRAFFSALGLVGDSDIAADLAQEAFIKAYSKFDTFDDTRKFFTWYYKILRNLALNRIRDDERKGLLSLSENETDYANAGVDLEAEEEKQNLEIALMKLEPGDREILILKEFENYSYEEIAELLEMPVGSVMSKLYYSRKKLSKIFLKIYE